MKNSIPIVFLLAATALAASPADEVSSAGPSAQAITLNQAISQAVASENALFARLRGMHPLVETYIQRNRPDAEFGAVPAGDYYFLGRLSLAGGVAEDSFLPVKGPGKRFFASLTAIRRFSFIPRGFAQMAVMDAGGFTPARYNFRFVKREFLGDVRCVVLDVTPRDARSKGEFIGRIWVEDQGYHVVRFNGTYTQPTSSHLYFHFDSWRVNCGPDLWLPAYIYSEEGDRTVMAGVHVPQYKAQTRLWGYETAREHSEEAFTNMTVDVPQGADDQSDTAQETSPTEAVRQWERQAEENVTDRLEQAGLLAAPGPVDKVLDTVVQNLEVSNHLDLNPEVHVRMLMTTPLECFAGGHTIVISRGLLDVLPDEASLAAVLAHELAHILSGQQIDTRYAFADRLFINDDQIAKRMSLGRDAAEERSADDRAVVLLKNSPYAGKLQKVGLFFRALNVRAPQMPNLIQPLMGDAVVGGETRFAALTAMSGELHLERTDEIEALPLGSRIRVDPWSSQATLIKTGNVHLLSAREKLPFEVTPFWPHLTRVDTGSASRSASMAAGSQ